jgi:hypothetical protein
MAPYFLFPQFNQTILPVGKYAKPTVEIRRLRSPRIGPIFGQGSKRVMAIPRLNPNALQYVPLDRSEKERGRQRGNETPDRPGARGPGSKRPRNG